LKNKYSINGNVVIIYCTNRKGKYFEILIDLDDFDRISQYTWYAHKQIRNKCYYAGTTEYLGYVNGKVKYKQFEMQSIILDAPEGFIVHHRDHNTLDNRKKNLDIILDNDNKRHRNGKNSNNTSGYRNVSWSKQRQKWIVQLQVNGKNKVLGAFDDIDKAGAFAAEMRKKYYGELAGKD
jgi:hypothetical protein